MTRLRADPARPTFENTLLPLERAMLKLDRVVSVVDLLTMAVGGPAFRQIEVKAASLVTRNLGRHLQDPRILARLDCLAAEETGLAEERRRLVRRHRAARIAAGAGLPNGRRRDLLHVRERLAELATLFAHNLVEEAKGEALHLRSQDDFAGLPSSVGEEMRAEAKRRGGPALGVITLQPASVNAFLTYSSQRALREKVWRAHNGRGAANRAVACEILELRARVASILGHRDYATVVMPERMAGAVVEVMDRLETLRVVLGPALRKRAAELDALLRSRGQIDGLRPWDWRFAEGKVAEVAGGSVEVAIPRYELEAVLRAAHHVAGRLFGVTFQERSDLPLYHETVRAWTARDRDGNYLGLLYGDFYARDGKRPGAWTTNLQAQSNFDGSLRPIVCIVYNFIEPEDSAAARLDDARVRVFFHEFGHALHALFSQVEYPTLSCLSVPIDAVEFPAQLFEHWAFEPEIRAMYDWQWASEPPVNTRPRRDLTSFSELFASACFDLAAHRVEVGADCDPIRIAEAVRAWTGLPEQIGWQHEPLAFQHVFAHSYAAGYYSYVWSSILDADGFMAFRETGDAFAPELSDRLSREVLSRGDSRDPATSYRAFRGREPRADALLESLLG